MPDSESNRRENFRVEDMIPMRDTPISSEEYEMRKLHIGIRSRQGNMLRDMLGKDIFAENSAIASTEMAKAVEAIDAKLNYLIGVNMLNDANRSELEERPVNLSVTGASFVTSHKYSEGDPIAVTLMLPMFPPTVLDLVGEVVRAGKAEKKGQNEIGVRFSFRCEDEEETIAKYVFKRDREMIRLRNRHEESLQIGDE